MHWTEAYKLIEIICEESDYTQHIIDERLTKLSQAFPNDEGIKEAIKRFYESSSELDPKELRSTKPI